MADVRVRKALVGLVRAVEMFGMDSAELRRVFRGPIRDARAALNHPGSDPDPFADDSDTADSDSDLELAGV